MSFEYRELTTQIFFNAGERSPGHCDYKTKREDDDDDDQGCPCASSLTGACPCLDQTQQPQCTDCTDVTEGKRDKDKDKEREALAFLRQQLREAVAAG